MFLTAAACAMEGLQGAAAKVPGQPHHSPFQGLILPGTHPASETAALLPESIMKHRERKCSVQSKLGVGLDDL